ncbi:MAG: PAS domain-containing protein [Lachnospiraceae bacterium]|nr:PAS domain-containing protein [Lachnospiraceae bacterium]
MNDELLQKYKGLCDFMSDVVGPNYEIVLSDLRSVLYIRHGEISGREVGAPITDNARRLIESGEYRQSAWKLNYRGVTASGKTLRCSTLFIMNKSRLEGLLCINFDDTAYKHLADEIFSICHPDSYIESNITLKLTERDPEETFYANIDSALDKAYYEVIGTDRIQGDRLSYEEKLAIISQLQSGGLFSIKGAVPYIADKLGSSVSSLYRYITIVKKNQKKS